MKFSRRSKYFLRGMGFGILVTVVMFSVALVFYKPTNSVPDEEIAGTEENESDVIPTEEVASEEATSVNAEESDAEETASEESEESEESGESEEVKQPADPEKTENQSEVKNTETVSDSEDMVSFKISSGQSSDKVAENLYRAGLIDNPGKFNTYLEQNGYDNTIHVGTFNIPKGSTYEEIAHTISK